MGGAQRSRSGSVPMPLPVVVLGIPSVYLVKEWLAIRDQGDPEVRCYGGCSERHAGPGHVGTLGGFL